jgi:anti-sigma B factor antagonist
VSPGTVPVSGLSLSARTAGGIAIAELSGRLTTACSPVLRDQLLGLLRRSSSRLVIDLSKVTDCDVSGLAVLVSTKRRARLLGGSLCLAAVPPQVDKVLHVTGLHRHFDVFGTVQAAAASPPAVRYGTIDAAARDWAARVRPLQPGVHTKRTQNAADFGELREVTAALTGCALDAAGARSA